MIQRFDCSLSLSLSLSLPLHPPSSKVAQSKESGRVFLFYVSCKRMAMTPPPTIAQTGDALAVLTAAAGSLSITNVSLWAAQTVVGPLISAPIETLGVLFRTVLGMSGGGDHLRLVACQPSINVVIFTRHVVSSACACGVALIGVSAVWPLIRGSVRRAAAKGQQGLVDISSALLALQGKSGGGGGHPHQVAANDDALGGTATTSASTTSSSATWPPHQSAATAAQPQPAAAGTLQATLEEIVSLQRTKPTVFGQRIAAIVQRGLWWVQGRVAGWFVRCVVLSSAMLLISAAGDRWLGHRCPQTHVAEGTAYRTLSWFQFYDLCVTMPGRWELRWPGLCQWPMYVLKAFPMGYLPSIVRQAPSSSSATTSANAAAATAAADGVRVLTEGQISELIRLWRWPAYTAWYLVCNPLVEATECVVDCVVARLGEWSRLLRGGRTHHRHHHHNKTKRTHTDETALNGHGAAAAEAPSLPSRRGTSPNRVDSNQQPQQQSAPPPPAPAAEEPRPVTLFTRALGVTLRTAICAALTAGMVCIGERCAFLDRLPIVGGRGASYAAASMLLAVLP